MVLFGLRAPAAEQAEIIGAPQGFDAATQSEQALSAGGSSANGIWGLIELLLTIRMTQRLANNLRSALMGRLSRLEMTTLDDQRIGDSIYRVMYDAPMLPEICYRLTLRPVLIIIGAILSIYVLTFSYGEVAPELIWLSAAIMPAILLITAPLSRITRRVNQKSRAAGSATTNSVYWYEDPSTVSAPVISFSAITNPSSPTLNYSSGIPHYTQASANAFTYVLTVTNASGDMYSNNTFLTSDGQGFAFQNSGSKNYTNFAGGTNPPTRNYGVGTGVTTLITSIPRDLHTTITSNHFTRYDASTPYGSHNNQRISFSTPMNLMGTTARPNQIDEDSISSTVGNGNNGTRVPAVSIADNPSQSGASYSWNVASTVATYETVVRGGVLRHDQTNYSTGYLPAGGPNYSSGRNGAQYYQVLLEQQYISSFKIVVTGSYGGCWVCMPDNSAWNTSLSGKNGWADMFTAYRGSGVPTTAEPGCATGTVMSGSSGTFTCTFGTESSSNNGTAGSVYRILIRWRLDAGDSITAMSYTT